MESCLAETGADIFMWIAIAAALIVIAVLLPMRRKQRMSFSGLSVVALLMSALLLAPAQTAFAAEGVTSCPAIARPDTSSGVQGATQIYNVLQNDTPTAGSSFVLGSLRLALVSGHVLGSSVSTDKKVVTALTEGVYTAFGDGTIHFTPEAPFVGTGEGVAYSIDDTSGKTLTSTYIPTVTGASLTCSDPGSESVVLEARAVAVDINAGTGSGPIVRRPAVQYFGAAASSDGMAMAYVSNEDAGSNAWRSSDGGQTWAMLAAPGFVWKGVAMSGSGTDMALAPSSGFIYTSTDSGATWTQSASTDQMWNAVAMSSDGQQIVGAPEGNTLYSSQDGGATWAQLASSPAASWSGVAVSDDGNTIVASSYGGFVYVSADAGATWAQRLSLASWQDVASSADGTIMYAAADNDYLYVSTDSGATWTQDVSAGQQLWTDVATTASGTLAYASVQGGDLYRTVNTGATWQDVAGSGPYTWKHIAVSDDGVRVAGYNMGAGILTSQDSGATWSEYIAQQNINATDVDLDSSVPGQQLTLDRDATEGWTAIYDPNTDTLTVTMTNALLFSGGNISYTLMVPSGCQQPPAVNIVLSPSASAS